MTGSDNQILKIHSVLKQRTFLKQASTRLEGIMFLLKTDTVIKVIITSEITDNHFSRPCFVPNRIRSRNESAVCTAAGSPLGGSRSSLGDVPGWIRTARRIPVEAAMMVVTM